LSNITPSELLSKLIENNIKLDSEEKIQIKKDNKTSKKTYYNHLHTLFRLFDLIKTLTYIINLKILLIVCFIGSVIIHPSLTSLYPYHVPGFDQSTFGLYLPLRPTLEKQYPVQ